MEIVFRVDASTEIGTGHVMRCLTLANQLREKNVFSHFICRDHIGHMAETINIQGHTAILLEKKEFSSDENYLSSLGSTWQDDAEETAKIIRSFSANWIVVDHYAVDARWETQIRKLTNASIMVIDGQANRSHNCDLLLDQTYTEFAERKWRRLVPKNCRLLTGFEYALFRSEFIRDKNRLNEPFDKIHTIVISFGGIDAPNMSNLIVESMNELNLIDVKLDVLIGRNNPHKNQLCEKYLSSPNVRLHIDSSHIASIMSNADLAITGGGGMLLEQVYLGLPSIAISIADNQIIPCQSLANTGTVIYLGNIDTVSKEIIKKAILRLVTEKEIIKGMRLANARLVNDCRKDLSEILFSYKSA